MRRLGAPSASRDGTIYKTFDDSAWIDHLGIKGTNGRYDNASVAIEFANELGLALDGRFQRQRDRAARSHPVKGSLSAPGIPAADPARPASLKAVMIDPKTGSLFYL